MKAKVTALFLIGFSLLVSNAAAFAQFIPIYNRESDGLTGPVSSIITADRQGLTKDRYDKQGNLLERIRNSFWHDSKSNKKRQSFDHRLVFSYNDIGELTKYEVYDSKGIFSGYNQIMLYERDKDGKLNSVNDVEYIYPVLPTSNKAFAPKSGPAKEGDIGVTIHSYHYDKTGKLRTIETHLTQSSRTAENAEKMLKEYRYDTFGNIVEITFTKTDGSTEKYMSYRYDDDNNLIERVRHFENQRDIYREDFAKQHDYKNDRFFYFGENIFRDDKLVQRRFYYLEDYDCEIIGGGLPWLTWDDLNIPEGCNPFLIVRSGDIVVLDHGADVWAIAIYKKDGSLGQEAKHFFDQYGNETRFILKDAEGPILDEILTKYEYDSYGNWLKKAIKGLWIGTGKNLGRITSTIYSVPKYDGTHVQTRMPKNNDWITTTRTIFYYE